MKIHNKGQIVLPVDIRKRFNLDVGDLLEFEVDSRGIHLYPVRENKVALKGCLREAFEKYGFPTEKEIAEVLEKELSAGSET